MAIVKKLSRLLISYIPMVLPWLAAGILVLHHGTVDDLQAFTPWLVLLGGSWLVMHLMLWLDAKQIEFDDDQPVGDSRSDEERKLEAKANHPWHNLVIALLFDTSAVVMEEVACRAPLLIFFSRVSPSALLWITIGAIFFTLLHYKNIERLVHGIERIGYIIVITILGFITGWLTVSYQSLWPAIFLHFVFNTRMLVGSVLIILAQLVASGLVWCIKAPFRGVQKYLKKARDVYTSGSHL